MTVSSSKTLFRMFTYFTLLVSLLAGAIFASPVNAATTWSNKTTTDGLGANDVGNVTVRNGVIYAASGGVSISTNGGATFTNTPLSGGVTAIAVDGAKVYAGSHGGGLSISTDGGATFPTTRTSANGLGSNRVMDVFINGSTIYAACASSFVGAGADGGLSISTDGGATFTNKNNADGLGTPYDIRVRSVFVSGGTIYAAVYGSGLSISTDGGSTFTTKTSANGLGDYPVDVFVSGSNVYVATSTGISISSDGGATFTTKTTADGLGSDDVAGVHASGLNVYAATMGGLSISTDGGLTFINQTTVDGLRTNRIRGIFVNGSVIYAAMEEMEGDGMGGLAIGVDSAAGAAKEITAFSFASPAATGIISGTNIAITVPYGTNVTALVPTITHTGASVSPNSGVAQNFSSPVNYTVTAADTTTKVYTVTVTIAPNPARNITAFRFISLGANGVISGTNIAVTVPYGTNVTALVPTITHTGASVSPNSGVAQNFSSPVNYTVTAAGDGKTKVYTVTVTVAPNPAKEITSFRFTSPPSVGVISGNNITLIVPAGTDRSALVATFRTTGAFVKVGGILQDSGLTVNDFTAPVIYTVTAADATTRNYRVVVRLNVPPVAANDAFAVSKNQLGSLSPSVLNNDTDANGDSLTAKLVSEPSHKISFVLYPNGTFAYRPEKDFVGTDSFTYRAYDGRANSNLAMVTITVRPPSVLRLQSGGAYDGWVKETKWYSNVGGLFDSMNVLNVGDDNLNRRIYSILDFDTSTLPDTAVITKVTLAVDLAYQDGNPFADLAFLTVDIRNGFFGDSRALESIDFQSASSSAEVGKFIKLGHSSVWSGVLDSSGRGWINRVGVTQFRLRFARGTDQDAYVDNAAFFSGESSWVTWQPQLIIEYYLP